MYCALLLKGCGNHNGLLPKNHLEHTHYTLLLLLCQNYHNYEMTGSEFMHLRKLFVAMETLITPKWSVYKCVLDDCKNTSILKAQFVHLCILLQNIEELSKQEEECSNLENRIRISNHLFVVVFLVIQGYNNNFCLSGHPGKSESYLDAIRKNIEWLKKHNKEGNKEGKCSSNMTYITAAKTLIIRHN